MTTSATFINESAFLQPENASSVSIFDDVEAAKQRFIEMRKAGKRRQNSSARNNEATNVPHSLRYVLEAETALAEVAAQRSALEARKSDIQKAMMSLITEIRNSVTAHGRDVPSAESISETSNEEVLVAPKKKQRYFESKSAQQPPVSNNKAAHQGPDEAFQDDDDLSSVVCPYELLGKCTDPACPHMHLNR